MIGVRCEGGRFYYKPHDCGIDEFCHEITDRFFSDVTRTAEVIEGDGFGFCTELVPGPLEKEADAARYFYHYGAVSALFSVLNGADLHENNVLACGVYPCIIDLENLLSAAEEACENALTDAEYAERVSIRASSVLGRRSYLDPALRSPLHLGDGLPRTNLPEYGGRIIDINGHEEA